MKYKWNINLCIFLIFLMEFHGYSKFPMASENISVHFLLITITKYDYLHSYTDSNEIDLQTSSMSVPHNYIFLLFLSQNCYLIFFRPIYLSAFTFCSGHPWVTSMTLNPIFEANLYLLWCSSYFLGHHNLEAHSKLKN